MIGEHHMVLPGFLLQHRQGLLRAMDDGNAMAVPTQDAGKHAGDKGLIVHNQQPGLHRQGSIAGTWEATGPRPSSAVTGRRMKKWVPWPGALCTSIVPPCRWMIVQETASPSPVPSTPRVVKNGSKMRATTSGAMPTPVSPISISTWLSP